jgi:hypothetical protein
MEIVNKNINNLKPYEKNPRINDEAVKYVDVIIKRWEQFTGEKAVLLDT